MKARSQKSKDDLRPEYEFDYSKAIYGKYHKKLVKAGTNLVILEPDIAKAFGNSSAVNKALRSLLDFTRSTRLLTDRPGG